MRSLIQVPVLAALVLVLSGCTGNLAIWGVNVPLPDGPGSGDDDDGPPDLDFSQFDGIEYLNIDWSPDAEAEGHADCAEEFDAFGANTTLDDSNLCPACNEIWTVTLVAANASLPCLSDGTGQDFESTYVRKIGMTFVDNIDFRFYRNRGDSDLAMEPVGIGAIDGVEFTWSGIGTFVDEYPELGYDFFFSGEGSF